MTAVVQKLKTISFDVFHSLHCLVRTLFTAYPVTFALITDQNYIRRALYPDHYPAARYHGIEHTCRSTVTQALRLERLTNGYSTLYQSHSSDVAML